MLSDEQKEYLEQLREANSDSPVTVGQLDACLTHFNRVRWLIVDAWIIIFTLLTVWAITSLRASTASVSQLQRTNCGVEKFLVTAEQARINTAKASKGDVRTQNLIAANGYYNLALLFASADGHCAVRIPTPPTK